MNIDALESLRSWIFLSVIVLLIIFIVLYSNRDTADNDNDKKNQTTRTAIIWTVVGLSITYVITGYLLNRELLAVENNPAVRMLKLTERVIKRNNEYAKSHPEEMV